MNDRSRAVAGLGVCLELTDRNGRASFFYPSADSPIVSAMSLCDLAVWLAENGYMHNSDGSAMILAG